MNRVSLLSSTGVLPIGGLRRRFVPMRQQAQDETGGGGGSSESGSEENNSNGNSDESSNQDSGGNNNGQAEGLDTFWNDTGEGDESGESSDDTTQASQALGTELKQAIDGFNAQPLFTKEIAEAIANGDFDGVNQALTASHRATIQQSLTLAAKMVGAVTQRMQTDFDRRIQNALGNQENNNFLEQQFPLAKNPQYRPVVERVWNQALKNTKGDRQKAIRQTRGMLEAFGSEVAPNLRDAPDDSTAGINTNASKSFVQSLLER